MIGEPYNPVNNHLNAFLRPYFSWDAEWFFTIAKHGYLIAQQCAFFPIVPLLLRVFGTAGFLLLNNMIIKPANCIVLLSIANRLCSSSIYQWNHQARVLLLYLFNPIVVFFTASYTEGLFTLLTNIYILNWMKGTLACSTMNILISILACLTRQNGVFLAGYGLFNILCRKRDRWYMAADTANALAPVLAILVWTNWTFKHICYDASSHSSALCLHIERSLFSGPQFYAAIQKAYWGVGLFLYWKRSNIIRFLLATPFVVISIAIFVQSLAKTLNLRDCVTLKWVRSNILDERVAMATHQLCLTILVITTANVEILPRVLLSCSPLIYVYFAEARNEKHRRAWLALSSFYGVIGCVLFALFYPWT